MRGERKIAVAGAVYGAVVIAVLATQDLPFPTVWDGIVAIFALSVFGGGVFCLVLAYRHRADMPGGLRRVVSGLGIFFLVIGSLAVVALVAPSTTRWTLLAIGCLLVARGVAFKFALRVMKRRNAAAVD